MNSSMAATPKNAAGDILYLTRVAFFENQDTMVEKRVSHLEFGPPGLVYGTEHIYTDSIGMIYLWLPEGSTVLRGQLEEKGEEINFTPNNEADRDIDANDVGALIYDSDLPRYTVTVAGSNAYSLTLDMGMGDLLSGTAIVEQGVFTYYLQQLDTSYTLFPYVGSVDANGNRIITPLTADALVKVDTQSDYILYRASIYVQRNTAVWYAMKRGDTNVFNLDLSNGDIEIIETDDGLTIRQNGYTLSGFLGEIFITSAGFPTDNTVTVRSVKTKESNINITMDALNIIAGDSALAIESGTVNLSFGEKNNMIHSGTSSPVQIGEDAVLNLSTKGNESIKLSTSSEDSSIITGAGTLNLNNQGGFLDIQETENTSQIAVGQYNFEGQNDEFTTELYKGHYSYTVVGFLQNNYLYPIEVVPQNDQMFMARGIKEIFDTEKLTSSFSVSNGTLTYTLTVKQADSSISMYKITDANQKDIISELESAGRIKVTKTDPNVTSITFTIDGSYFKDGNLTINAAVNNEIPFEVVGDVIYPYDATSHGITVIVDDIFKVYYSTTEITAPDASKTNAITYTDVGEYTVYYYIYENGDADPNNDYTAKSGSATFSIVKSNNEWTSALECPDIICGNAPQAKAVPKWGDTVVYKYYFSKPYTAKDNTVYAVDQEITVEEIKALTATHTDPNETIDFYVVAFVAGTDNYDDLESKKIYFSAIVLSAYTQSGRQLDEIQNASTTMLQVAETGAFSVYFGATSIGAASNLTIDKALPIGTKVTFITLTQDGTAQYYYHFIREGDIQNGGTTKLMLNQFLLMGSTTSYTPPVDGSVEYQFCFEYEELDDGVYSICLNGQTDVAPKINCTYSWDAQLRAIKEAQDQKIVIEGGDEMISIRVNAYATGTGYKFLAFKVTGEKDGTGTFSLVNMETALSVLVENNVTNELQPVHSSDDFLLFKLGETATTIDQTYTLVLSNVPAGTYQLNVMSDVRILTNDLTDSYALFGQTEENHVETSETVYVTEKTHIYAELLAEDSVISSNQEELNFKLYANEALEADGLTVTVYKKVQGKYVLINGELTDRSVAMSIDDSEPTSATISCPSEFLDLMPNGTYRLVFYYGGATCTYNVIVHK